MSNISAIELKVGNIIKYKNNLFRVLKTEHVKPGKGGAFIQAELKGVKVGTKLNERFRSDETLDKVNVETVDGSLLYAANDTMEVMDMNTCEQFSLPFELLTCHKAFLSDNLPVKMILANEEIISVSLPEQMTFEVTDTQPYIKGQTVKSSFKPATLSNGLMIDVPEFVENGDKIIVNTETEEYVKRAD
jgi:elongation factor P